MTRSSMSKAIWSLAIVMVATFAIGQTWRVRSGESIPFRRKLSAQINTIRPYSYKDIELSASIAVSYYSRILIFDGKYFSVHNLRDKEIKLVNSPLGGRGIRAFPLLVEALTSNFPERFKEGKPAFQVMYEDGDAVSLGVCIDDPHKCKVKLNLLPPLLAHGSVPVNIRDFPFVKPFPNWFYGDCLYHWKILGTKGPCRNFWEREFPELHGATPEPVEWENLIPTLVWRGSDHPFGSHSSKYKDANVLGTPWISRTKVLENKTKEEIIQTLVENYDYMTPRWRGVIKTILATNAGEKWIDVKFAGGGWAEDHEHYFNEKGIIVRDKGMSNVKQAAYRYQIDFGGGGGTTWRGVLTKLAMPGVLFHHECNSKDWFFDLMIPWIHYIPVSWDLSDLQERYRWAEANPHQCQEISKRASQLAHYIMSEEYMERLYQDLFVDYLGQVIDAYQPSPIEVKYQGQTVLEHFRQVYDQDGFEMTPVSKCDHAACRTPWINGEVKAVPYVKQASK